MKVDTLMRAEALHDDLERCVVIDVRHLLSDPHWGHRSYLNGHIPGAQFLDMDSELSGPKNGRNGRHPLPDPLTLTRTLGRLGVQHGQQVVVYDQNSGAMAARLWWLLRHWLGHDAVAVLDGGWDAWVAAGYGTTTEVPAPQAEPYTAQPEPGVLVQAEEVLANLQRPGFVVVDARTPERFEGRSEPIDPVAGHIPGARNRPFGLNLGADGLFKPAPMLVAEWRQLLDGLPPQQVVHQCGSGVTACHNLLAMDVAGLPGSRIYPGSWSEWCADPSRPVATGP